MGDIYKKRTEKQFGEQCCDPTVHQAPHRPGLGPLGAHLKPCLRKDPASGEVRGFAHPWPSPRGCQGRCPGVIRAVGSIEVVEDFSSFPTCCLLCSLFHSLPARSHLFLPSSPLTFLFLSRTSSPSLQFILCSISLGLAWQCHRPWRGHPAAHQAEHDPSLRGNVGLRRVCGGNTAITNRRQN